MKKSKKCLKHFLKQPIRSSRKFNRTLRHIEEAEDENDSKYDDRTEEWRDDDSQS